MPTIRGTEGSTAGETRGIQPLVTRQIHSTPTTPTTIPTGAKLRGLQSILFGKGYVDLPNKESVSEAKHLANYTKYYTALGNYATTIQ